MCRKRIEAWDLLCSKSIEAWIRRVAAPWKNWNLGYIVSQKNLSSGYTVLQKNWSLGCVVSRTVAYLGFHKGDKFPLATSAYKEGPNCFFLWPKLIIWPKEGGHGPMPSKYASGRKSIEAWIWCVVKVLRFSICCVAKVLRLSICCVAKVLGVVTVLGAIGIKEDVGRCHRMLARTCADKPWCSGHQQDSCSGGCLLHITAYQRCPPSALYLPVRYVRASADASLVMRHPPQPWAGASSATLPFAPNTVTTPHWDLDIMFRKRIEA